MMSRRRAPSVAFESRDKGRPGEQLQLCLQSDDATGKVLDPLLLDLHGFRLSVHLVLELDHRGQRAPDPVGDAHRRLFRADALRASASIASMRLSLASMKSSALSMASPARSAAALAESARVPSSSSASSGS